MADDRLSSARFVLWVDGVGGYLVCPGREVVLGQPTREEHVDVPILGDVSRRHAVVARDREHYLITSRREVTIDGARLADASFLKDGADVGLGAGVRFRFRQPHPLSATARLEFAGRQRIQPPVDGVILLSETCVLGPGETSHVVCRDWRHDVILFRQGDRLLCRAKGRFEIDGRENVGQGAIELHSRIAGVGFSLSLEPL